MREGETGREREKGGKDEEGKLNKDEAYPESQLGPAGAGRDPHSPGNGKRGLIK